MARELIGTINYPRVGRELSLEYSRIYAENGKNVLVFRLINHSRKYVTDYVVDADFYADGRPQLQTVRRTGVSIAPGSVSEEHELIISAEADEGELRVSTAIYDDLSYCAIDVTVSFATSEAISRMANQILENPDQYALRIHEYEATLASLESLDGSPRESKTVPINRQDEPEQQTEPDYEPIMKDTHEEPDYRPASKRKGVKRYILLALAFLVVSISNIVPLFNDIYFDSSIAFDYAYEEYKNVFGNSPSVTDGALLILIPDDSYYHAISIYGNSIQPVVTNAINSQFGIYSGSSHKENGATVCYTSYASNPNSLGFEAPVYSVVSARLESATNSLLGQISYVNSAANLASPSTSGMGIRISIPMETQKQIGQEIAAFTNQTGIPLVVVFETPENVFGGKISDDETSELIMLSLMAIVGLSLLIKSIRNSRFNKKQKAIAGGAVTNEEKTGAVAPLVMAILSFALALLLFLSYNA